MATHKLTPTESMLVNLALLACEEKKQDAQAEFTHRLMPILNAHGWSSADFRLENDGELVAVTPDIAPPVTDVPQEVLETLAAEGRP